MQSIVPFFIVMIPWLGFFSPKGMLPYQSTQSPFPVGSLSHSWNDRFSQVIAGDYECEFWLKPSNTAPPVDLTAPSIL